MIKVKGALFIIAIIMMFMLIGCSRSRLNQNYDISKLNVVSTTTMLTDLSKIIGGEHVSVIGLMGPGIDPHLYQASAGDVSIMQESDVIVYNGLRLEGKMGDIFESMSNQGHKVICIEKSLDKSRLFSWEDSDSVYDPHIWFDVYLWKDAATAVANGLSQADPEHAIGYETNLSVYLDELDIIDTYIRERVEEVNEEQRILVTAHDAFNYFGKAYGFEVMGLQGVSTDTEAGTSDISKLSDFIVDKQLKAIFVESSVPPKTIEALQAAVKARDFDVYIGGELYSDSLGGYDSGAETYTLMIKHNIDTIVEALK